MKKWAKAVSGAVMMALLGFILNYLLLGVCFFLGNIEISSLKTFFALLEVLLICCSGAIIILLQAVCWRVKKTGQDKKTGHDKKTGQDKKTGHDEKDTLVMMLTGTALYLLLMIFAYPYVRYPYVIIPRGELALDYGVLAVQILGVCGAIVCMAVDGLALLYLKAHRKVKE